jgi:hypothetical protein
MKKLLLIMELLVLCLTCRAQIEKVVLTPVKKGEEPQVVLDSIKKAFPDPISRTLSILPAKTYGKEWNVEISEASAEMTPEYYEVYIKGEKGNYTAVYDKSGNLLKVKQVIKNTELPEKIKTILDTKYAGWKIVGNEERFTNAKKAIVQYKVILKKGLISKAVFFDSEGNIKLAMPAI